MSEAIEIKPGEFIEIECPEGSVPTSKVGTLLGADPKSPDAVIAGIENRKVFIGPFKGGDLIWSETCSGGQRVEKHITLKPLDPQKLPEHEAPIPPWGFGFPLWLFFAVALFILAMTTLMAWLKLRQKTPPKTKAPTPPPLSPEIDLKRFLDLALRGQTEFSEQKALYSAAYDKLRAYLEFRFKFSAEYATSSEFFGQLRVASVRYSPFQKYLATTEMLLIHADQVRFAGAHPDQSEQNTFLVNLKTVFDSLEKIVEAAHVAQAHAAAAADSARKGGK